MDFIQDHLLTLILFSPTVAAGITLLVPRERVIITQVGPVVGTYTGPGVLGLVVSQGVEEE